MKSSKISLGAVIEIASNCIRLKIGQIIKNKIKILENIEYPLSLGRDTFDNGKISFEQSNKASDIIKNYITLANEYGAEKIRAVATTAVREAKNKDYILDQIRLNTGIEVEVIDSLEEKFYIYKTTLSKLSKEFKQSSMMVYIGSGNVGISLIEKELFHFTENVQVGALRISELFNELSEYSNKFYIVLEEYLHTFTDNLSKELPFKANNFIASGSEIALIAELCDSNKNDSFYFIEKEKFYDLYNDIKDKTIDNMVDDYNITWDQADLLLPTMCIFKNFLSLTSAKYIITPMVFLVDSILFETLSSSKSKYGELNKNFNKSTLLSSEKLAQKFDCDKNHYKKVQRYAVKIFDKLKKIHGLSSKEKLLLQSSSILHDCGKYIHVKHHHIHSYNIIKGSEIIGLNSFDIEIIACISLYHSSIIPSTHDETYISLPQNKRVIISKLSAILRLADALDSSHEDKFNDINVNIKNNILTITVETDKNIDLEQWNFTKKGKFFEEVFGIKTILKKKRVI